jgi:hypothetical protein
MSHHSQWSRGYKRFLLIAVCLAGLVGDNRRDACGEENEPSRVSDALHAPVRLQADGKPIDIATFSQIAHAGPAIADVDGDGDRDLLVGDFPGFFWYFQNEGDDAKPRYTSKGKLQAGGVDAKTPIY